MDADRMPGRGPGEAPLDDPITIDPIPDTGGFNEPIERGMGQPADGRLGDPAPGVFDGPVGMAGAGTDEVGQGSAGRYLASDVGRGFRGTGSAMPDATYTSELSARPSGSEPADLRGDPSTGAPPAGDDAEAEWPNDRSVEPDRPNRPEI